MVSTRLFVFIVGFCFMAAVLQADDAIHGKENQPPTKLEAVDQEALGQTGENLEKHGFPTFHPLIVHFPIVLIIAGFPFYLLGMLRQRIVFRRSGIVLASFGFLGALLAGYVFHPHTVGLTPAAQSVLSNHDLFASATLYLVAIAVALGALTCTHRFQGLTLQASASVILLLSVVMVSLDGHYGAKLVHMHGVGPKGHFLVTEHISLHIPFFSQKPR